MTATRPHLIEATDLPDYPIARDERIDSHYFMPWERRRWLNSSMRLRATPECRALYFDLICVAYDQTPVGTLPDNMDELSKLAMTAESHFAALCALPFGPLHHWHPCLSEGERRLMHPVVLQTVTEAISRRHDNRARNEAGNAKKRRQRLRAQVAGYHADLAKNDAAVIWMDDWLVAEGCEYRSANWVERAMAAWTDHVFNLNRRK
ncbi:MAG: hypothetical protein ACWA5A_09330 [Marinibacterium sp.]